MDKLVVIIGAGFSKPLGLPLAKDIKERFDRDQREKLLNFSSGEWMWEDGKSETDIHNGKLYNDWLPYSYALNELIKTYKVEYGGLDNYELFYQFVLDIRNNFILRKSIYESAKKELLRDYPSIAEFKPEREGQVSPWLFRFSNDSDLTNIVSIINYLIADLLRFTKSQLELAIDEYMPFVNYLKNFSEIDVFTLNHDLLLEKLLGFSGIEYTRGFTKEESEIYYEDNPLPVFRNDFRGVVRLHKLHGSIDFYRFEHFENQGKLYLQPTGNYNYYCPTGYRAKHTAHRVNPKTGKKVQDLNFDVVPKFITGIHKADIIKNDLMYSVLFERFEQIIKTADNVLISGYSFGDEHINLGLKTREFINVTNQNPNTKYPYKAQTIRNIESLKNLN